MVGYRTFGILRAVPGSMSKMQSLIKILWNESILYRLNSTLGITGLSTFLLSKVKNDMLYLHCEIHTLPLKYQTVTVRF
jgi:hypothetical protein